MQLSAARTLARQLRAALALRPCLHAAASRRHLGTAAAPSAPAPAPAPALPLPSVPQQSPEGIPLLPGEVLVHTSGSATAAMVRQSWIPSIICGAYMTLVKSVELYTPHLPPLLNGGWTLAFLAMTVGSSMLALGTTSVCMRALVLTADGQALRIFPYGALMGIGLGRGVVVPLKLLRENADFGGAKRDPDLVFVQARKNGLHGTWSPAHLMVDKPPSTVVPRLPAPGSGLSFTQRGLAPAVASALAAAASAGPSTGALGSSASAPPVLLPPLSSAADRAALKRYVLLVWLLQGNCVADMERLRAGEWRTESICADLGEAGLGGSKAARSYQARVLEGQWVEARVKEGAHAGRAYYWNKLTWETAWQLPFSSSAGSGEAAVAAKGKRGGASA